MSPPHTGSHRPAGSGAAFAEGPTDPALTIGGLLREGIRVLSEAGIENAVNEAVWIVECALGMPHLSLYIESHQAVSPEDRHHAFALLQRRAGREPLQYILGTQEFCGFDFEVGPQVLIPRPETELLVQEILEHDQLGESPRLADVGTGSGCIAIALAKRILNATVYAVDLSRSALQIARRNAIRHRVDDRISWLEGHLVQPLRQRGLAEKLSVIVSNPPYVSDADMAALPPEVRDHEPALALRGGEDGMTLHRSLLREAAGLLAEGGRLILEVGHEQAQEVCRIAREQDTYRAVHAVRDHAGIERVVCARV